MTYDYLCCNCNRGVNLNIYGRCELCNGHALIERRETSTPPNIPEAHELVYNPARGAIVGLVMVVFSLGFLIVLALRGC